MKPSFSLLLIHGSLTGRASWAILNLAPWGSWASATVALFAITLGWRFAKAYDRRQWHNQKLTEKRISVHDQAAPLANDLYCYFWERGNWKELTPPELVNSKRKFDKLMNVNRFLLSRELWSAYQKFIHKCFKNFNGFGEDAQLRISKASRDILPNWQSAWSNCFCSDPKDVTPLDVIEADYIALMKAFAAEIGVEK